MDKEMKLAADERKKDEEIIHFMKKVVNVLFLFELKAEDEWKPEDDGLESSNPDDVKLDKEY
ncbi:28734_t:CDS:2 [Racocetra persica]|uniref:28734_t:CDS:1 n=1 Tax=Racocetra persica TaxID=160502 RepID=A0ACA9LGP9_9GLOM|nr:28734_t:CDS:2 [Racocetra persica]